MSTHFNPNRKLIVIEAHLVGPRGDTYAMLSLDTGATTTVIRTTLLSAIGYDPDALPKTVNMATGSDQVPTGKLTIDKIEALEQERTDFAVLAHTLPQSTRVDGVLGLDFLRSRILNIDFQAGEITLT